jgi:hypothetical protein
MLSDVKSQTPGYSLVVSPSKHTPPLPIVALFSKTGLGRIDWIDGHATGWGDGIFDGVLKFGCRRRVRFGPWLAIPTAQVLFAFSP